MIFSSVQYSVPYKNAYRFSRQDYTEPTMARYGLTTEETAPTSPVIFDYEFFNHRMRYNNGIFIIDNPGYYRIDMKSYHNSGGSLSNSYLCLHLMINSISELHQYTRWAASASDSAIFYLDVFDTVYASIEYWDEYAGDLPGLTRQGAKMNNIQIEKIF